MFVWFFSSGRNKKQRNKSCLRSCWPHRQRLEGSCSSRMADRRRAITNLAKDWGRCLQKQFPELMWCYCCVPTQPCNLKPNHSPTIVRIKYFLTRVFFHTSAHHRPPLYATLPQSTLLQNSSFALQPHLIALSSSHLPMPGPINRQEHCTSSSLRPSGTSQVK